MSVRTTADEHLDSTKYHLDDTIEIHAGVEYYNKKLIIRESS